jgi:hypothetical protein
MRGIVDAARARCNHSRVPDARLGEWRPLESAELRALLDPVPARWWLAGGRALELFAGRSWRSHGDVDAGILRADQARVFAGLRGWALHAAKDGELRRLDAGEIAPPDANSVWCRAASGGPWRFELLLDSSDGSDWVFRRDAEIRLPLAELVRRAADGCPYLRPDVQLLYKAKQQRPQDEADFTAVAGRLDGDSRLWLRASLERAHPGHPWLARAELAS